MKLRRPPQAPPTAAADLDETLVMLLLVGHAANVSPLRRLQFTSDGNVKRASALWQQHRAFLLAEAERRGIARPHDGDVGKPAFYGEYCCWLVAKCPERYGG